MLFREQFFTPPHSLASPDEVSTPGIVSRKSKLSFQVKVRILEIISSCKAIGVISCTMRVVLGIMSSIPK